ncbi:MAG: Hpt domain-containing protein [Planctomycetota bacterium]
MTASEPNNLILSDFADDPDMVEIIEEFVGEIPERIAALQAAFDSDDTHAVASLAHQLKGSGGGYGFNQVSEAAGRLENAARSPSQHDLETIRVELNRLVSFCSRLAVR